MGDFLHQFEQAAAEIQVLFILCVREFLECRSMHQMALGRNF